MSSVTCSKTLRKKKKKTEETTKLKYRNKLWNELSFNYKLFPHFFALFQFLLCTFFISFLSCLSVSSVFDTKSSLKCAHRKLQLCSTQISLSIDAVFVASIFHYFIHRLHQLRNEKQFILSWPVAQKRVFACIRKWWSDEMTHRWHECVHVCTSLFFHIRTRQIDN